MSVRNIRTGDFLKKALKPLNDFAALDPPHSVPDPVPGDKIVERSPLFLRIHDLIDLIPRAIGQENGARIGICHIHMADPVKLLVLSCVFMLAYDSADIVVYG